MPPRLAIALPKLETNNFSQPQNEHLSYNIDATGSTFTHESGSLSVSEAGTLSSNQEDLLVTNFKLEELQVLEKLGEGASSVVHRAFHSRTNRYMALKRINVYDRSSRHQIVTELLTLSKSTCPYLVSLYGAFFKDGSIILALELMDANSLGVLASKSGFIPESYLAFFTSQILAGLYYLRRKHVVHRDIKPHNICLHSSGLAKLSDFGITTRLDSTLQGATSFVGTSLYMSPERILGSEYKYPSDIWSLGLTLIECATGKFPYPNTGAVIEMTMNIVKEPSPTLPREGIGGVRFSEEFDSFISMCLAKDPEKRATADQLLQHPWITKIAKSVTQEQVAKWMTQVLSSTNSQSSKSNS